MCEISAGFSALVIRRDLEIPAECVQRQAVGLDAFRHQIVIVDSLRAADDLAVALGRQHVDAQRPGRVVGRLHIERLDLGRPVRDHHRPVQLGRQQRFVEAAEVGTVFEGRRAGLLHLCLGLGPAQDRRRLIVGHPREGGLDRLQLAQVALEELQLFLAPVEHPRDDVADELFGQFQESVQLEKGDLGLNHPELGQVASRLGFFRAKGRAQTVDASQRHAGRFEIELARLCQVGLGVFKKS